MNLPEEKERNVMRHILIFLNLPGEKERNVIRNILTFQNLPGERKREVLYKHSDISEPSCREKEINVIRNILTFQNLPWEKKREMLQEKFWHFRTFLQRESEKCYTKHSDISEPSWREKERNVIRNILTILKLPGENDRMLWETFWYFWTFLEGKREMV